MEKKYLDYNESNSWERLKHTLRSWKYIGVGKSLLIWFLAISFVPLISVSYINFLKAYQGLTIVADKSLKSTSQLRLRYLNTYFEEATDFLEITSTSQLQINYFNELSEAYKNSGQNISTFTKSTEWQDICDKEKTDIDNTLKKKDFYNLLFILPNGEVLFSVRNEIILGNNLFNGDLRTTQLSKTLVKVKEANKPQFSDLEIFQPSMGIISGFFINPVIGDNEKPIGYLALQITESEINKMLQQDAGYGETGQAYIVGKDLYLRSTRKYGNEDEVLNTKVENKKTKLWKDFLIHRNDNNYLIEHELNDETGTNYDTDGKGTFVLGIYRNIDYLEKYGINWALVEEIEHDEAFAYARELSDIVKVSFIITILIVILISILVTRWFVNPIKQLSSWGKQVAIGELNLKTIKAPENEIGDMSSTFNKLVTSLQSYANVAKTMAKGDFSEKVEIRSNDDVLGTSINRMVESFKSVVNQANNIAKGDYSTDIKPRSDNDSLGKALFKMTNTLRENSIEIKRQDWLKTGYNRLADSMKGALEIEDLSNRIIEFYCDYLNARIGLVYITEKDKLKLKAHYGVTGDNKSVKRTIKSGEGIIGQVYKDRKPLIINEFEDNDLPPIDYGSQVKVAKTYVNYPLIHDNNMIGVISFGIDSNLNGLYKEFIENSLSDIAITIVTLQSHIKVRELLDRTRDQANELEVQQEELRQTNEELQEQTNALKISEENLQAQKEELKVTNEELEERSKALEIQRDAIKRKNKELELARLEIEKKAKDIAQASQYKSEFLANMSHELRTPLNSIIVLSQLLAENKRLHLDDKEKQYASTINSSGNDLLDLINDILDLSKVESGKIDLNIEKLYFSDLEEFIAISFKPILDKKGLKLDLKSNTKGKEFLLTDIQRVQQIVKNLFSNAIKFTENGSIGLEINYPASYNKNDEKYNNAVSISVRDSGIGIPQEKQEVIFEAFKQADGTTSRRYGGTGLGLSISKNFAELLGGKMTLESEEGKGSVFSLILPLSYQQQTEDDDKNTEVESKDDLIVEKEEEIISTDEKSPKPIKNQLKRNLQKMEVSIIRDDKEIISQDDKVVLIIEDDYNFASVLLSLGHEHNFKGLIALDGETGIYYADYYSPKAIILDVGLPGIDGYQVMEKLKLNPKTRHIPVHFISAADRNIDALKMGAIGYLTKPANKKEIEEVFGKIEGLISKPVKKLLIVEDEEIMRKSIVGLMKDEKIKITETDQGNKAMELLKKESFDCMILDLGLEDISGFELLEKMSKENIANDLPIVIYTGKELSKKENDILQKYSQSIILKGAHSFERLLAETTLFLHQVESNLPGKKRKMLESVHGKENILQGKTILIVDDDMRNVFAVSSLLESNDANVVVGKNGREGIEQLEANPNINLVLMDIMMPEMDGYEAMRRIRKKVKWKNLPIIALTAKAMKEDRQKCLDAGANEYLSKPVEKDKLISLLRVWLYQ